ncbi:MAG: PH domain-containing protein [Haloarculaceae archaeon]
MPARRLSPLSVFYRAGETVMRLAWLLVIATVGSRSMGVPTEVGVGVVAGGLVLAMVYQFVYWERYEYELTEDTFDIRSGVLSRRTREIPLGRVQNVDLRRNVLQRALGIAEVRLETAGGSETEAQLRFVGEAEAQRLRDAVSRRKRGVSGDSTEPEPEADLLFAITPRELLILGVTSVDLRLLSLASVFLPVVVPSVTDRFGDPLVSFAMTAPVAAFALAVVAAVLSGLYSVTNYYGFRLSRTGSELRYERGLLQQFAGTIPLEKVQTMAVSENVLARRLGYASLSVETAGYAPGDSSGSQSAVPLAERDRVFRLARSIDSFGEPDWQRPPRRARTRYVVRYVAAVLVLTGIAYAVDRFTGFSYAWYLVLLGVPLAPVGAHLKWRNLAYAVCEDHVLTRAGFWSRETRVVPFYRIQTVVHSQSVFQRRRRLATVLIDTAGGGGITGSDARAVDIDADAAAELRETVHDRLQDSLDEARAVRRRERLESITTGGAGSAPDVSPTD